MGVVNTHNMASVMKDVCGNSLTCSSPEALKLYNQALGHFVSTRSIFIKPLQRALELDGGFVMARCLMVDIHRLHVDEVYTIIRFINLGFYFV